MQQTSMKEDVHILCRPRFYIAKTLLFMVAVIFMAAPGSVLLCQTNVPQPKVIVFRSSVGDVTLRHLEHTRGRGVRCIACHHRYVKAEPAACSLCHPKTEKGASEKFSRITRTDALHKRCINCHSVTTSYRRVKPPLDCSDCHIRKSGNDIK